MTGSLMDLLGNDELSKFSNELVEQYEFLHPKYVLIGITFYVISIAVFQPNQSQININKSKKAVERQRKIGKREQIIFCHNLLLAIYSAITFSITAPIIFNFMSDKGFTSGFCEFYTLSIDHPTFAFWNYLFYLSKYYEFIDTFIIIAKGRKPSFLQEYHHIGAVIGMWIINLTGSFGAVFFTLQNSFIHTIMYTYYAFSVIGYRFPFKSLITICQLIQFIIGLVGSTFAIFNGADCATFGEKVSFCYHLFYGGCLLVLFIQFYLKTYTRKSNYKVSDATTQVVDAKKES